MSIGTSRVQNNIVLGDHQLTLSGLVHWNSLSWTIRFRLSVTSFWTETFHWLIIVYDVCVSLWIQASPLYPVSGCHEPHSN